MLKSIATARIGAQQNKKTRRATTQTILFNTYTNLPLAYIDPIDFNLLSVL